MKGTEINPEFLEDVKNNAVNKWKWRNPYLVAFLVFLHPIFMLLSSLPATFICLLIWLAVWRYWADRPTGIGLLLGLIFGAYAFYNTRWKNAAIEKWKYGLPGTGLQNPRKMQAKTLDTQQ